MAAGVGGAPDYGSVVAATQQNNAAMLQSQQAISGSNNFTTAMLTQIQESQTKFTSVNQARGAFAAQLSRILQA